VLRTSFEGVLGTTGDGFITPKAARVMARMRALPFASLDAIAPGTSLILAPHPDDESLGCGGLIAALAACGRPPIVVCVTDGSASHPGSRSHPPARLTRLREAEMRTACDILGLADAQLHFLGLPDAGAPLDGAAFEAAAARIAALARLHGVTTIFATSPLDPHCDHEATAALGREAARLAGTGLTYYPVWSWLIADNAALPVPHGVRLDITAQLPVKRRAIAAHESQYTGLITDSPEAFQLPAALLSVFEAPYEVFLTP
jgi:LmbE family N-acetylglucosaminyl deacetylase